ncbi:hypothetical protein MWG58_29000 [Streptomyces sp. WAC00276]|uniref:hypothetical protein n=1 Tax=Streptomyces sp. WAC00276 TaxID=2933778 RepID=UPI001FFE3197|nr:hypothetical protein [Streptomyces sp. WAC00276]MCK2144883.1 hypothetical protein [Streptomyces sp. WAC00276]
MTPRTVPPPPDYPPDSATPPPEDDWWDRLYADDAPAKPEAEDGDDVEPKKTPWWARKRDADTNPKDSEDAPEPASSPPAEAAGDSPVETTPPPAPRRRLSLTKPGQATAGGVQQQVAKPLPDGPRIRRDRVLYVAANAAAAGAGWWLGLGPWLDDCLTYYLPRPGGGWVTLAVLTVGIVAVDARTHGLRGRHRHPLVAVLGWAGRIPLATAVLAIALYNTN